MARETLPRFSLPLAFVDRSGNVPLALCRSDQDACGSLSPTDSASANWSLPIALVDRLGHHAHILTSVQAVVLSQSGMGRRS